MADEPDPQIHLTPHLSEEEVAAIRREAERRLREDEESGR